MNTISRAFALCLALLAALSSHAATLTVLPGSSQTTRQLTAFGNPIGAVVRDSAGQPIAGVQVAFQTGGPATTFIPDDHTGFPHFATTNAEGIAIMPGPLVGSGLGNATVEMKAPSVTTDTAIAQLLIQGAFATSVAVIAGNGSSAPAGGGTFDAGTILALVRDSTGAIVPRALCALGMGDDTVPSGYFPNGSKSVFAIADDAGVVTAPTITTNAIAGDFNLLVLCNSIPTDVHAFVALHNVPVTAPAGTITVLPGSSQATRPGTAFANPVGAVVRDNGGQPIAGVPVKFTWQSGGNFASFSIPGYSGPYVIATDAQGIARLPVPMIALNGPGGISIEMKAASISPNAVSTTLNVEGLPAASLEIVAGDNSTAFPNTPFTSLIQLRARDANGEAVPRAYCGFGMNDDTVPSGSFAGGIKSVSALADGSGLFSPPQITANGHLGGWQLFSYCMAGANNPFTFVGMLNASPDETFLAGRGPYTVNVGSRFNVEVLVTNGGGAPVAGHRVTFWQPDIFAPGAQLDATEALTDASGIARVGATANYRAGSYELVAEIETAAVVMSATNVRGPDAPATMVLITPDDQTTKPGTFFETNPAVRVLDGLGQPVANVPVTFYADAVTVGAHFVQPDLMPPHAGQATVLTNSQGIAAAPPMFAMLDTSGGVTGVAESEWLPDVQAPFNVAAAGDGAVRAKVVSGHNQVAAPDGTLHQMTARVVDSRNRPVADAFVWWEVPPGLTVTGSIVARTDAFGRVASPPIRADSAGTYTVRAVCCGEMGTEPAEFTVIVRDPPPPIPNVQGLWWGPQEHDRWSVSIAQLGSKLFAVIDGSNSHGGPAWWVLPDGDWNETRTAFTGAVYAPLGGRPSAGNVMQFLLGQPVGTVTLTFADTGHGTLGYTISGVTGSKAITRAASNKALPATVRPGHDATGQRAWDVEADGVRMRFERQPF